MIYSLTERETSATAFLNGDIAAGIAKTLREIAERVHHPTLVLDLTRLGSINSIGCAEWSKAIKDLLSRFAVEITGAPVAFVDYCNTIPSVLTPRGTGAGVLLRSFKVPYACHQCQRESEDLVALTECMPKRDLPERRCAGCGTMMEPEVHAADYLAFLQRTL